MATYMDKMRSYIETVGDSDDCWDPGSSKNVDGYSHASLNGKLQRMHRVACLWAHGEPPSPSHHALHSCNNRWCCNPNHLRWGTHSENMRDIYLTGSKGAANHRRNGSLVGLSSRKLEDWQVIDIRRSYFAGGITQRELGERHGISRRAVGAIVNMKSYMEIEWKA